jgi:hypothetical protein
MLEMEVILVWNSKTKDHNKARMFLNNQYHINISSLWLSKTIRLYQ